MKKTTHKNLSERLVKYGALSVAIAGITEVNGQIVHVDLSPTYFEGGSDSATPSTWIDFDGDLFDDFQLVGLGSPNVIFLSANSSANSFLGNIGGSFSYPYALNSGALISSGQANWQNALGNNNNLNFASCFGGGGNSHWCNQQDKYLGLRFKVKNGPGTGDDVIYYGWMKLDVNASGSSFTIKEYAYNATDTDSNGIGDMITAGQTVLGIDDNVLTNIKVVALHKSIGLYNLPETSKYAIYNMTGQEVLKGTSNERDYVIEASSLASGVYIVELGDANTNAVIRKKVVLQ